MSTMSRSVALMLFMMLAAAAAWLLTPTQLAPRSEATLDALIPRQFGGWIEERVGEPQVNLSILRANDPTQGDRPTYDEVLMRTYRREDGQYVMLALAYGRKQRQELKIHRPELCYYAQGYTVQRLHRRSVALSRSETVKVQELLTQNGERVEPVTYWIRIGDKTPANAWQARWSIFSAGMQGSIPDGILVRVSSIVHDAHESRNALTLHEQFLSELYTALSPRAQRMLAGGPAVSGSG